MKLYFSPLACSLATRISLYEYGVDASYVQVDLPSGKTVQGQNYLELHPLALVPLLEIQPAERLSENVAILQYITDSAEPERLRDPVARARFSEWLGFIATELHKAVFTPLLDERASAEAKAYALGKSVSRLGELERRLTGRVFALERFSAVDAYLFTILNWSSVTPVDLTAWPAVHAYHSNLRRRPAFARAFEEELALYLSQKNARARNVPLQTVRNPPLEPVTAEQTERSQNEPAPL